MVWRLSKFCIDAIRIAKDAGLKINSSQMINLVPMFCPDWMAKLCKSVEPLVEAIPLLRTVSCGQNIIVANR